jgi:hypothetical protein
MAIGDRPDCHPDKALASGTPWQRRSFANAPVQARFIARLGLLPAPFID